ncbi:methyltransferase, partial [Cladochytrium replicatum]
FRADVFRIIATIPSGKVTTYGHIARLAGYPRHSRHVGRALQTLSAEDEREAGGTVPWQRVINSRGRISLRVPSGSVDRQAEILRAEGVDVQLDPLEMYFVSLKEYGWFP